ncbi:MAG: hypothetical protein EOO61_20170 [Hymenobacter sp.]|nr:MAG: hypothetical protein EOO61_20170 [Hymenobacter sp.]
MKKMCGRRERLLKLLCMMVGAACTDTTLSGEQSTSQETATALATSVQDSSSIDPSVSTITPDGTSIQSISTRQPVSISGQATTENTNALPEVQTWIPPSDIDPMLVIRDAKFAVATLQYRELSQTFTPDQNDWTVQYSITAAGSFLALSSDEGACTRSHALINSLNIAIVDPAFVQQQSVILAWGNPNLNLRTYAWQPSDGYISNDTSPPLRTCSGLITYAGEESGKGSFAIVDDGESSPFVRVTLQGKGIERQIDVPFQKECPGLAHIVKMPNEVRIGYFYPSAPRSLRATEASKNIPFVPNFCEAN